MSGTMGQTKQLILAHKLGTLASMLTKACDNYIKVYNSSKGASALIRDAQLKDAGTIMDQQLENLVKAQKEDDFDF